MMKSRSGEHRFAQHNLHNMTLWPISLIYRTVAAIDRWRYQIGLKSRTHPGVPVVVVGNITAGGTGKSPLVRLLAQAFSEAGHTPGIALRGYGGSNTQHNDSVISVTPHSDPAEVGDEALEHALHANAPVAVCAARALAARTLIDQHGCDVILCDDGLQHHALERDVEIAVVDSAAGFGNGWFLPAGPLRESVTRLTTVDHVVINGDADMLSTDVLPADVTTRSMEMKLTTARRLDGDVDQSLASLRDSIGTGEIVAMAGTGNPDRFFSSLRDAGFDFQARHFSDHHRYTVADLAVGDASVLMTAKDFVKIDRLLAADDALRAKAWCVMAQASLCPVDLQSIIESVPWQKPSP